MSNGFDAYYKWLSIPPHDQPPNHYRLLGLGLFESDADVIAAAADRQMAHVQTYKNGPHSDLSQKLLNEIAAAKICLLRPQKKSAYDKQLREQMAADAARVGPLGAAVVPQLPQQPLQPAGPQESLPGALRYGGYPGTSFTPPPPTLPPPVSRRARSFESESLKANSGMTTVLIAAGAFAVLLAIGILVALKSRANHSMPAASIGTKSSAEQVLSDTAKPASPANVPIAPSNQPSQNSSLGSQTTAKTVNAPPVAPGNQPRQPSVAKPTTPAQSAPIGGNQMATNMPAHVGPTTPNGGALPQPLPKPDSSKPTTSSLPIAPVPRALPLGKAAVPDAATIAAINARLGDLSATPPADLIDQAHKATEPVEVYVLLRTAIGAAIKQGDAATAISATDELARRFAVDSLQVHWQTLDDLRAHADSPKSWAALANDASSLIDEASATGNRDLANRLAELSISAARNSDDLDTIRKVTLRIVQMRSGASPVSKSATTP